MHDTDKEYERVEDNDPRRCQAIMGAGQCKLKSIEESQYCILHGGFNQQQTNAAAATRIYRLSKWQARCNEFSSHQEAKSLREEIGILRILLEETWNMCTDSTSLLIYSAKIADLVMKVEKVVASCHRLEASSGMLLDKTAALHLAMVIVEIMGRYITDQDTVDQIANEIMVVIVNQRPVSSKKEKPA